MNSTRYLFQSSNSIIFYFLLSFFSFLAVTGAILPSSQSSWKLPRPVTTFQHGLSFDSIQVDNLRIAIITAQTKPISRFDESQTAENNSDAEDDANSPGALDDPTLVDEEDDKIDSGQSRTLLHLSADYADLFIQNKKDWANFQQYDYIHTVIEADGTADQLPLDMVQQSIHWIKVDLIQRYLPKYDWVCWLDMDTIVIDETIRLEDYIARAMRIRPQVNLIVEGSEDYRKLDGRAVRSGVILMKNSFWSQRLLTQLKDLLSDADWQDVVHETIQSPSHSVLDNSLVFLLNADHAADSHAYFMTLQDRWNQHLVYLPKIGILHFSGCTEDNQLCLDVLNNAIDHMLDKEKLIVYLAAPYVQHLYNIFVAVYVLFAVDRLFHILGRFLYPCRRKKLNKVVDDSTDPETVRLINESVQKWSLTGTHIQIRRRTHRFGFKAGAMNEAMKYFPSDTKFIAIFDADFVPGPSFLRQTVPYLMEEQRSAFVQTRWVYTNAKESLLTRMQEISLNFHFLCEQEVRFRTHNFFNFNGTAGVWRLESINDAGGWHTDTLVEDMDLSLRVWARGWDFIFLNDVTCLNEIPPTFSAYRGQQHRWTSGPMQVLKKAFRTIFTTKRISIPNKIFCLWFFLRNYVHIINFLYFLVLVPMMIWFPRVTLYEWAVVYLPAAISMTNVLFTPSEWYHVAHYVLFENAICMYKTGALICGVLNIGKAKQWIVTPKFARNQTKDTQDDQFALHNNHESTPSTSSAVSLMKRILSLPIQGLKMILSLFLSLIQMIWTHRRLHRQELFMSVYLIVCARYGFLMRQTGLATFSLLNSIAYLIMAFGWLGRDA